VDVLGKVVYRQQWSATQPNLEMPLDLGGIAAGRYELQVELATDGRLYRTQLPVQRQD
jgi:hypothetical protein